MVLSTRNTHQRVQSGSALLLTLAVITMLVLEVSIISLIAVRGFGEEGVLMSQNVSTRRAAEVALSRLSNSLVTYINSGGQQTGVDSTFAQGQANAISSATLSLDNPDGGTSATNITIDAWVKERHGNVYHLVGRARQGMTDILIHRWVPVCKPGILSTIITTGDGVGYGDNEISLAVASDGRVFFGDALGDPGNFYTWKEGVGLSTLATGMEWPSYESVRVGPDDRVYWGQDSSPNSLWTWKASTGLSTILNGTASARQKVSAISTDGTVFFGKYSSSGTGLEWAWKNGVLTTIGSTYTYNQREPVSSTAGRMFFGEWSKVFSWQSGVITTLFTGGTTPEVIQVAPDGRMFAVDSVAAAKLWSWKSTTGLTTILTSSAQLAPAYTKSALASDGRLFIAEASTTGKLWTWKDTTGLTTIGTFNRARELWITPDGRLYFQDSASPANQYTWSTSTGLTTILAGQMSSSSYDTYYWNPVASTSDERVYFISNTNPGSVWTWSPTTGLSTIVTNTNYPGYASLAVAPNGRVYFGTSTAFLTWSPTRGLNTILYDSWPGMYSIIVAPDGRVYFGDSGSNFWTWKETPCD